MRTAEAPTPADHHSALRKRPNAKNTLLTPLPPTTPTHPPNAAISSEQKDGTLDKAATLGMIVQLTELNKEPAANKGALEKLISGFGRSFGTVEAFNFPGEALGYSEKPGSTTTAGKALD